MKLRILFSLIPVLLIAGCKEKEAVFPRCSSVISAPQEFLDYWFMPKGSWWVYRLKGSNPAVYDTVRANLLHFAGFDPPASPFEPCIMRYEMGLGHSNSTYFPGSGGYEIAAVEGLGAWAGGTGFGVYQSWTSAFSSEGYIFSYPIIIGHRSGNSDNWATDTNAVVTPTYSFPNSVTFMYGYYTPDSSEYVTRKISYTKKVGITYRKYFNGNEWELINYYINQ